MKANVKFVRPMNNKGMDRSMALAYGTQNVGSSSRNTKRHHHAESHDMGLLNFQSDADRNKKNNLTFNIILA